MILSVADALCPAKVYDLMPYLLDAVYLALLVIFSPFLTRRSVRTGRYREGWGEKLLGSAPARLGDGPCVWFHAVSVGEVLLLRPVIAAMRRRRPGWEVVVSTTSRTGLEVARRTFPDIVTFYAPMDLSWAVKRAVARIRPTVLALVELEIWPNLIRAARESGARVVVVNGRLSARSHRGYGLLRMPLRSTFHGLDAVLAQTGEYARRFVDLGVPEPRVRVTGSVKYDGLEVDRDNARTRMLRRDLRLDASEIVFVAGSTMEGEETAAFAAYEAARATHPRLRLVVVPRHAERFDQVAEELTSRGARVLRRSGVGSTQGVESSAQGQAQPVVLVDTIGELAAVWGLADIAFVGGSLYPGRGGQNMMEPAAFGASVLFGPHTRNFKDTVEQLLARDAARVVTDAEDLKAALLESLEDPEGAASRGASARSFVLAQEGASERTLAELDRLVDSTRPAKTT